MDAKKKKKELKELIESTENLLKKREMRKEYQYQYYTEESVHACEKCGSILPRDAKFCYKCGFEVKD